MLAMKSAPSFEAIRGEIRFGESMAKHTSWRVGGPADYWFVPEDKTDLAAFLAVLPEDVPLLWTGLGSNLLVRDGGIRGAVVCTHRGLSSIKTTTTGEMNAGAGAACATARDPGYEIADAEAAELDCRLIKAGHFFFTVPRYGDTRAVYGRIEASGFDRTENRFTVWGSERKSAGVLVRYIESVEGDGLRYADARCRFRRGNPR